VAGATTFGVEKHTVDVEREDEHGARLPDRARVRSAA
jgi:hypothetical protein